MVLGFILMGPIGYEFLHSGLLLNKVNGWECLILFLPFTYFLKKRLQKLTNVDNFFFNFIEFIYIFNLFLILWCYIIFYLTIFSLYNEIDLFSFYNDKIHLVFFLFLREPVGILIFFYGKYYSVFAYYVNILDLLLLKSLLMFFYSETFILLCLTFVKLSFILLGLLKILGFWVGKLFVIILKASQFFQFFLDFITMLITKLLVFLGLKKSWKEILDDYNKSKDSGGSDDSS